MHSYRMLVLVQEKLGFIALLGGALRVVLDGGQCFGPSLKDDLVVV